MSKKSIILLMIGIILLLISILLIFKHKKYENETGHWYGMPENVTDIVSITIRYNNGKDIIFITPQNETISYFAYDNDGNYIKDDEGNEITNIVHENVSEIVEYIFKYDIKYLKDYSKKKKLRWELSVDTISTTCMTGGADEEPEWFSQLLKKLNVETYGNISSKYH